MDRETEALLQHASALREAGEIEQAIAAYSQVLQRKPDLPESWYNLGWLQRRAGRFEDALRSYAEALRHGVSDPEEVHINRSVILSDHLVRLDEAQSELEKALALRPDYLPALLNLGNLHEDRGERAAAEAAYRRALAAAPGDALALSRLAGVVDAGSTEAEAVLDQLSAALAQNRTPSDRADLGFALARLLDSRGEYAEAFEACTAANLASRESFGAGFRGYDPAAQERFVDETIAAFPGPASAAAEAVPDPIFICGMFRSGSTLIEQIIASHGSVEAGGELPFIPALAARIPGYPASVAGADAATIAAWRDYYRQGLERIGAAAGQITDKRPDNFLHVGLIKTLFPAAKIVHTRRNRLDNLLSLYFLPLGPQMPYALDLADAAHWYDQHDRLMAHWQQAYPADIFTLDYDELVRDPRPLLQKLFRFLDLGWEEAVLEFHRRSAAVRTASVWQVREPLYTRSSGRWRNYREHLQRYAGSAGAAR